MNLLPYAYRRKLVVRKLLMGWIIVWTGCGLAGGAVCLLTWTELRSAQSELAGVEEQAEPLREVVAENRRFKQQIEEIWGRESVLGELGGSSQPVSLLAIISRSARAADERLQIQRLNVAHVVPAAESGKPAAPAKPGTKPAPPVKPSEPPRKVLELTLTGVACDDVAVTRFVSALREQGVFESVELRSSIGIHWAHGEGRQYDVVCRR